MAVLKNGLRVAAWTILSRALGFARDVLVANRLGAGATSDAFFIAMQLPNLVRRLLGEGAFNVALVPALAREKSKGPSQAAAYLNAVLSWLMPILLLVTVVGIIGMPLLVGLMMPGWVAGGTGGTPFAEAVLLGRLALPYVMLVSLAAFIGAVCNTYGRFSAYAAAPVLLNVSFVLLLGLYPWYGAELDISVATVAALALPLGGVIQLVYMMRAVRRTGVTLKVGKPVVHAGLKPLLYRLGPAALGVGILQVGMLLDNMVASFVGTGAVSYLQYANRFYQFPLAMIGIAVATVLLPHLAVLLGDGRKAEAGTSFMTTLKTCLTLAVGATTALMLLAPELMQALLAHGRFSPEAAQLTSWAMMGFVLGLPAYILTKVTAPAFFAMDDVMTPVKASLLALAVNLGLNVLAVLGCSVLGLLHVAHVSIALATAVAGMVNAALQWHWLRRDGVLTGDSRMLRQAIWPWMLLATGMGVSLFAYKLLWPFGVAWPVVWQIGWLSLAFGLAAVVFAGLVQAGGLVDMRQLLRDVRQARRARIKPTLWAKLRGGGVQD